MISINLLPHDLRPIKRTPLPYILSALLVVLVLLAMAGLIVQKQAQIMIARGQLETKQNELQELAPIVAEYERMHQAKQNLATKIAVINDIAADRIIWSRQLWLLSSLAPDNFWFSNIEITNKPYREMMMVYNRQLEAYEQKEVSVTKPILRVSGYVVRDESGVADVNPLLSATSDDEEFSELFHLEPPSFRDAEFEGFQVREFTLEFVVERGREDA
jgi:Tfp pilus assembly protein PilN